MCRHGPVIAHCTDSEDFPLLVITSNGNIGNITSNFRTLASIRLSVTLVIHAQIVQHIEMSFALSVRAMLDARCLSS